MIELTDMQKDTLKEIGNMGMGHGATALSKLINKQVDISIPSVDIVSLKKVFGQKKNIIASSVDVTGTYSGFMVGLFDEKGFLKIIRMVDGSTKIKEELVVNEIINIISGSYLSALSNFMDVRLLPGVPFFISGDYEHIKKKFGIRMLKSFNSFFIQTEMKIVEEVVDLSFILVFDNDSINEILKKLN